MKRRILYIILAIVAILILFLLRGCCLKCYKERDISNEILCPSTGVSDRATTINLPSPDLTDTELDLENQNANRKVNPEYPTIPLKIDSSGRLYDPTTAVVFGNPDSIIKALDTFSYRQCPCQDSLFFVNAPYNTLQTLGKLNPEDDEDDVTGGNTSVRRGTKDTGVLLRTYVHYSLFESPDKNKFVEYGNPGNGIKIAVLDAGIHDSDTNLKQYFDSTKVNSCRIDIIDFDNSPFSTNDHGSLVTSVLYKSLEELGVQDKVDIVPIRTHYESGYTNLFNVLCGLYTAKELKVQVVNASFSFYSCTQPGAHAYPLFEELMKEFNREFTVVSSLGNSRLDLAKVYSFPSQFEGVIGVASIRNKNNTVCLSDFSNYHNSLTFYGAPGENPLGLGKCLRGSSFAAPQIAAFVTKYRLEGRDASQLKVDGNSFNMIHYKCWKEYLPSFLGGITHATAGPSTIIYLNVENFSP